MMIDDDATGPIDPEAIENVLDEVESEDALLADLTGEVEEE